MYMRHKLDAMSENDEDPSSAFHTPVQSESADDSVRRLIKLVSNIMTQLLGSIIEHFSSYHAKLLGSLLLHKLDNHQDLPTLDLIGKCIQSQSEAVKPVDSGTPTMGNEDELWDFCKLWNIVVDVKIISEGFVQENINLLQENTHKPLKRWNGIHKDIQMQFEKEASHTLEQDLTSNPASNETGSAGGFFRNGPSFFSSRRQSTPPGKEYVLFESPKEIYKRNGELFEAVCVNSIDQRQAALASNKKLLIEQVPEIFSFWKWGAVILAVYAIVNSLLVRFRIELVRFGKRQSAVTKALLSYSSDEDCGCSSDDDASVDDEDDDKVDGEDEVKTSTSYTAPFGSCFDFRVAGSSIFENDELASQPNDNIQRRFSWSNFANGKSVVKLWDGLGCSFSSSLLSLHDLSRDEAITSFFPTEICQAPAVTTPSPSLVLSAGKDRANNLVLSLADTRLGRRQALFAKWKASELVSSPAVGAIDSGRLQNVYIRDDAGRKLSGLDLRKATVQLDDEKELDDVVTWWDADGGDDVDLEVRCRDSLARC
uniref:Uncharacterized protein n=1 Tax=Kalanchoe fedtschenkoi TaxID=63787 RepID=A0A7N1A252_KALFE